MPKRSQNTLRQLRDGSIPWDDALARLDESGHYTRELAAELARRANDRKARRLLAAAKAYDEAGPGRFVLTITAQTLIEHGRYAPVLELPWSITRLVGFGANAAEQLDAEGRSAFLSVVAERLRAVTAGSEPADTLTITTTKHFIQYLDEDLARALIAWLEPRVESEDAAGEYEELDYAYGQVDPVVELALCCARAGQPETACRHLQARDSRGPVLMHLTELFDLAAIVNLLPEELRATWWPRIRGWAVAADSSGYVLEGESLETEWLLRAAAPMGTDVDGPLTALVEAAVLPQRLHDVLELATTPKVRALARRRLVEMTSALVTDLVSGNGEQGHRIRALRAAATTLEEQFEQLDDIARRAIAEAVRKWAAWLARYDTCDWLEHHYTAIAFAKWWRDEIEPAAARLRAEVASGNRELLRRAGWERLFSEDQLRGALAPVQDDP